MNNGKTSSDIVCEIFNPLEGPRKKIETRQQEDKRKGKEKR
jgi:hypothetical protein